MVYHIYFLWGFFTVKPFKSIQAPNRTWAYTSLVNGNWINEYGVCITPFPKVACASIHVASAAVSLVLSEAPWLRNLYSINYKQ
jgi:hypothetical protein